MEFVTTEMDIGAQCKQAARMFTAATRHALKVYLFLCREWKESSTRVLFRAGKDAFYFATEICLLVSADHLWTPRPVDGPLN